jgi:ABC-type ATPase involved in cell division
MFSYEKEVEVKARIAAAILSNPNIISADMLAKNNSKEVAKHVVDLTEEVFKRVKKY